MSAAEIAENPAPPDCPAHGFLSPRISFSTDFVLPHRDSSPDREHRRRQQIEWSREFEFSLSIEGPQLQPPSCGSPADEIFFEGKLLPLQVLGPSSRIHLVRKLLEQEYAAADRSPESSLCSSPLTLKSAPPPPSPPAGGIERKHRYSLKLVRLLRRSFGEFGKSGESEAKISTVGLKDSSRSSSSGESTRVESGNRGAANSGRILWKNLERCSKKNSAFPRKSSSSASDSRSSVSGVTPFSSNVRVAPVLNVPICIGPVKEVGGGGSSSTIAGLRKLLLGKKSLQITWSCPGGTI